MAEQGWRKGACGSVCPSCLNYCKKYRSFYNIFAKTKNDSNRNGSVREMKIAHTVIEG